jgi:hypothetical protein
MLKDYAEADGAEVWNMVRLSAYLDNVGSPFDSGPVLCACDTLTAANLGATDTEGNPVTAYTVPDDPTQPAPWFDPDTPASAEFLGFMPLTVSGTDDNPRARSVTNAVGGGGVFGPVRVQPRTITVQGVLIGTSCCGVDFGMKYLSEVLSGCDADGCDGGCFDMFDCCPSELLTKPQLDAAHRRTFRRTALVSGPTEVSRIGTGSCARGGCAGGDLVTVEFILVAATPWAWDEPQPVLDVPFPIPDDDVCVDWCFSDPGPDACIEWDTSGVGGCVWDLSGPSPCIDLPDLPLCAPGDCDHAPCAAPGDACADPLNPIPTPPQPTAPTAPFCVPLAPERTCYSIDLTNRPTWTTDYPVITVAAGFTDLRNVRITFYEKLTGTTQTCDEIADANRCNPANDFYVTFVPAGGAVTIDGQTGRATLDCAGDCRSASTVYGSADGGPLTINPLVCAEYCVCVEVDPIFPPDPDSGFQLFVSGR